MRPYLLITIDTESDDLWAGRAELTFQNILQMPRLQTFFEGYGIRPTYLITYPVAVSREGREIFGPIARSGRAEIGSHMHVWTTPPIVPVTENDPAYAPLAMEIPPDLVREKMVNVTKAVGELAGYQPRSHRAGRFGLGGRGLRILEELGYVVDTSVTPLWSWQEASPNGGLRGPDFRHAPLEPYFPDYEDLTRPGASKILEVPTSYFISRPLPRRMAMWLARRPRNHSLVRALRWSGLVRHGWLRPGRDVTASQLVGTAKALLAAGLNVLNVMFHSSEMAAGTSPATRTAAAVDDSYRQMEMLFGFLIHQARAKPVGLCELREVGQWRTPPPTSLHQ